MIQRTIRCIALLMASMAFYSGSSEAAVKDITAVFRPSPGNPFVNEFENTTPLEGYCGDHPSYCFPGEFSIVLPVNFNANAPIQPLDDVRKGPMFKLPSSFRTLDVVHRGTGETSSVSFRIKGFGTTFTQSIPLGANSWETGTWVYAPAPCQYGGVGAGNAYIYTFFWRLPEGAGICHKRPNEQLPPDFRYVSGMGISYELKTPNPLAMSSGIYDGSLTFLVGPGQDFDMGDVMVPDDNVVTLNFTLSVEHALKIEIPPGGDRIELLPHGGWQAWMGGGRMPDRLYRDQTVLIDTSSRFKMRLECGRVVGNTCGLANAAGHEVPLDIQVSLPHGLNDASGQAVNRRALRLDGSGTELFQPAFYIYRKPLTLHFEVGKEAVKEMLDYPGSRYTGTVAVIWDTEI